MGRRDAPRRLGGLGARVCRPLPFGHGRAHGFGTGIPSIFVDVDFYFHPKVPFVSADRASRLSGKLSIETHGRSIFWIFIFYRIEKFVSSKKLKLFKDASNVD